MWENTCGGYVGQILTLFDNLRVNPLTEQYFDHLDYGPIQAELGGHHAVVLYDKGGDFRQGDVLDPWPDQTPEVFSFPKWNLKFFFTGEPDYSTQAGQYPLTGSKKYPGPETKNLEPQHPFRPLDPPFDNETYAFQVVVDGPVQAMVTDSKGRRAGVLPDSSLVSGLPFSGLYAINAQTGPYTYFFLFDQNSYSLTLTATGTGQANVLLAYVNAVSQKASYIEYPNIGLLPGERATLQFDFGTFGQNPVVRQQYPFLIYPVIVPPPGVTITTTNSTVVSVIKPVARLIPGKKTRGLFIVTNNTGSENGVTSVDLAVDNPSRIASLTITTNNGQVATPYIQGVASGNSYIFTPGVPLGYGESMGINIVAETKRTKHPLKSAASIIVRDVQGIYYSQESGAPVTVMSTSP